MIAERWQSGRMRRFAKPLYGLTPVPRVRIPPSPPRSLDCREIPLASRRNTRIMPVFRDLWQTNRTAENGLISGKGATVLTFLWRAQAQSGFNASIRRMQCDQRPASRPSRVDFCKHLRESGWGLRRTWQNANAAGFVLPDRRRSCSAITGKREAYK